MDEFQELIQTITPGTRVKSVGYDANDHGGMSTVLKVTAREITFRLDRPVKNQGRSFGTSCLRLDTLEDYEIEGRVLKLYNPSHAYVGGRRALIKTIEFLEGEQ